MTLTPAYGRDYKSQKAVKADWDNNKDFVVNDISSPWNGSYCNQSDLQNAGITSAIIRYDRLAKIMSVKVK